MGQSQAELGQGYLETVSICPSMVYSSLLFFKFQHFTLLSMPPANTLSPISLMHTDVIGYLLGKSCACFFWRVSNTLTEPSSLALLIRFSSLCGDDTEWMMPVWPLYFLSSLPDSMSHTIRFLSAELENRC